MRDAAGRFVGGQGVSFTTAAQYGRHSVHRASVFDAHIREAIGMALETLVVNVRSWDDFPVQTGNLRASVGVNRNVQPSRSPIGWLPQGADDINYKALVKQETSRWLAFFSIGMVYATHVLERPPWDERLEAEIKAIKPVVEDGFKAAVRNAVAQLNREGAL